MIMSGGCEMLKIRLFCSAGMSTSLLVSKMRKVAEEQGLEVEIDAMSETHFAQSLEGVDVALLGPQIGYNLAKLKPVSDAKNVPLAVIPLKDYGMVDGKKVLELAQKLSQK
jgi:PTS system cellobiose-specific IIB component